MAVHYELPPCAGGYDDAGGYLSNSGRRYTFGFLPRTSAAGQYFITFPDDTSLEVEAVYQSEKAFVGHDGCVELVA